ncbi:MAG: magnesium/cobalt transporter CorA [candidate division KSB1 bacterium]|jgi:magnesium transporter|nr:magnesium/cobalt transporter CorA [candidate division KSB1 bacterium]
MKPRLFKKSSQKTGMSPGTIVHIGEKKVDRVTIEVIEYDESNFTSKRVESIKESIPLKEKPAVTWINITGLHDIDLIRKIGSAFNVHPLVQEDIVHTGQRPKLEDFDDHIYIVTKMIFVDPGLDEIIDEQISILVGKNFVITFQEQKGDVFSAVRDRIVHGRFRIRKLGADYLAYALMDAIVDHYFIVLERIGELVEELEEELLNEPTQKTLASIYGLKRKLITMRKVIWPLREVVGNIERDEIQFFESSTYIYLRDVYDHIIQTLDTLETYREMVSGMLDTYLSSVSNKMNQVMKVLTIIATIFIPLTFIAGIYGMNFEYMPELKWHWGYPAVWLIMIFVFIAMIIYFKVKKWI